MKTVVEARKIKKVYGLKGTVFPVLHGIDLNVQEGEFVGIMGPSGSGKTTLLNILATIDQPTSGHIVIDGENILNMNEEQLSAFRRNKLGFIFQDYNLLDTLTVKENILLPLAISKIHVSELERRVDEIADKFGIRPILEKYPYQISGGQKQRTAASRAIISNPRLILADEPTGALDSKSAADLLESLKSLNEQDKATIFMVTHDAFAASYCKRVLFIKDGNIFTELVKGNTSRKDFFKKILDVLNMLGGSASDII
ncbi:MULTISPECIES: ABC transporter ATP-binding protein [Clostridia]|jgi:putative ABC transport system ATP-binding protein|uniref:Putative ABC transport system ATP-binding protein n=1 Tax=Aminicella lysinilytica TaxID=433323 RepID=A0A4V3CR39_9FIRM|nr:ABC transporter ATP-binding protein [Aminicella lysinilytica]TDP45293.1 putative ABC transport system ATP-binding protein [Aminicella lysinilytica]